MVRVNTVDRMKLAMPTGVFAAQVLRIHGPFN